MLGNKRPPSLDKVDTIIGKETNFQGKIVANGTLRVDGRLEGEIASQGDVVIGEGARVVAQVQARNLLIAGEIKGNVKAAGRVEMASTAKVEGDLQVGILVVEDGAVFLGACTMTGSREKGNAGRPAPADGRSS
ncbi:hypothetical protein SY88_07725 [Clostridiales bacterium PH28_bin88]|nr:hypothetical protein SY88_07725 [Clostridiales bacterium PH28_bin88]